MFAKFVKKFAQTVFLEVSRDWEISSSCFVLMWCRRGDLNPHRDYSPLDPESSASTNSATSAYLIKWIENYPLLFYIFIYKVKLCIK